MASHSSSIYQHSCNQSLRSLSSSTHHLLLFSSPSSLPINHSSNKTSNGALSLKAQAIKPERNSDFRPKSTSTSISERTTAEVSKEEGLPLPTFKWNGIEVKEEGKAFEVSINDEIGKRVEAIKSLLESDEGEKSISPSAYHTAWVALVEDVNGSDSPQFPSALQWIIDNQLPDGSWGDEIFLSYDRLLCTLACIIVLKHWKVQPEKAEKGIKFFKENINKLERENKEHMPCGFETILPTLLQLAKSLNIEVPADFPALKEIFARRDSKLKRIPMDVLHKVPTSLLFSLESIPGLDWEKLLKVQSKDGSFLFCPSSTAFAFIESKDENCLNYLNHVAQKFSGGGVPDFYPIDFFEQLWIVDRLERLGISRYFQPKIKEIINYVYRNWNEKGLGWTKYSDLPDLDDTSMGFRLLRLNGYGVSANIFKNFEKDGEFCCMPGQSDEGATVMFNFYRATQVQFPGENILEDGRQFATNFLTKKRAANQILDKWIIAKDLPGEVGYALDFPWYASLPRIETRFYLEQYGGGDDVWISKTLYRLHKVSNNTYLELGKLDYNNIQALHRTEWRRIQEWYSESGLEELGLSRERLLLVHFLAASSIFEPERSQERLAWVKTSALVEAITSKYQDQEQRKAFVHAFNNTSAAFNERWLNKNNSREGLLGTLIETLYYLSHSSPTASFDILHDTWKKWLLGWQNEGDEWQGEAELLTKMINLTSGHHLSQELELNPRYQQLVQLSNGLCHQLRSLQNNKEHNGNGNYNTNTSGISNPEIRSQMHELVQLVLSSNDIDSSIKKTFLTVTKSFYYATHCDPTTINSHIDKVLFERVI